MYQAGIISNVSPFSAHVTLQRQPTRHVTPLISNNDDNTLMIIPMIFFKFSHHSLHQTNRCRLHSSQLIIFCFKLTILFVVLFVLPIHHF